ncbi:MAG TPA: MFS transporter, partial [Trebonia sp.]|nr:MFS transporter [Trebonia sp.]
PYWLFALVIGLNGFTTGLFISPNRAEMMNSVPAGARGAAGGMIATVMNSASVLSIGIFFSLMVTGLAGSLPHAMSAGLTAQGVPAADAAAVSGLPPIGVLFAAFLGYNPMQQLLGPVLARTSPAHAAYIAGRQFFPGLISSPFHDGLGVAFGFAIAVCVIGAIASALTGKTRGTRGQPPAVSESPAVNPEPADADATRVIGPELNGERPRAADAATADAATADAATAGTTGAADAAIAGVVTRADGRPAAGVTVTALNSANLVAGAAVTGADGYYLLHVPGPGDYVVVAAGLRAREVPVDAAADGDTPVLLTIGERA